MAHVKKISHRALFDATANALDHSTWREGRQMRKRGTRRGKNDFWKGQSTTYVSLRFSFSPCVFHYDSYSMTKDARGEERRQRTNGSLVISGCSVLFFFLFSLFLFALSPSSCPPYVYDHTWSNLLHPPHTSFLLSSLSQSVSLYSSFLDSFECSFC